MSVTKKIIINSLAKNINKAKKQGILNNKDIFALSVLEYYKNFVNSNQNLINDYPKLDTFIKDLQNKSSICNIRIKIPSYVTSNIINITLIPILKNIVTTTTKNKIYVDLNTLYDSYIFNTSDIKYSDNINGDYDQLSINLSDLKDGFLKLYYGPEEEDYTIYNDDSAWLTLSKSDLSNLTYFTSSNSLFVHDLQIKTYSEYNGSLIPSNIAELKITRNNLATSNQPPSIGDTSVKTSNRVTTTLTLAMFTTGLTPPYNDPEGDLIDAIRIDEISTANKGKFYLNGIEIVTGQIITREDLAANLFTHVGPDVNTIETDAFNFSARDEGSQIWIQ